jgi:tRNA dimethylallyltransferase
MSLPRILVLLGPTASGKTTLSLRLAEHLPVEIVNCDSQQVYRHMDIGTAKPSRDELARVPHHCFDLVNPDEPFNAGIYMGYASAAVEAILSRGNTPLVVGGTGLYARALMKGIAMIPEVPGQLREQVVEQIATQGSPAVHARLAEIDPASAERLHPNDAQRIGRALEVFLATGRTITSFQEAHRFATPRYGAQVFGMSWDREALDKRIDDRVPRLLDAGFLEEARELLRLGYSPDLRALKALGYKELFSMLEGTLTRAQALDEIAATHRSYARRQMTWFRKEPDLHWLDGRDLEQLPKKILARIAKNNVTS